MDTEQNTTERCQSCGMPLGEGFYGTDADEEATHEWCKFCYQLGEFVEPKLGLEEMIERSIQHMTQKLNMPQDKATELARTVIPQLKRWK